MANSYSKASKTKLTENFSISEFHCKGKDCGCTQTLHDPALSGYLQQIRDHFGKPITITSGYRCAKHNQAVGGASGSRHAKGEAADFIVQGIEPLEVAKYAESIGVKAIGLYGPGDGNFVHIDTRTTKSFWYGHKQEKRETFMETAEKAKFYVITSRVNGMEGVCTLLFDGSFGSQIQPICGYEAAVKMEYTDGEAVFSAMTIGTDHLEILKVSKVEM